MAPDADAVGPDRRARFLVIYLACGAASGLLMGFLAVGVDRLFTLWNAYYGGAQHAMHNPALDSVLFQGGTGGCFLGMLGAVVTVHFAGYWKQLRIPVCAASFWASLAGTISVLVVFETREELSSNQVLFVVISYLLLGAAYGFTMTLTARLFELGLKVLRKSLNR